MVNETGILSSSGFEILESVYLENKNMGQMHYHKHYEILYILDNSRILTVGEKEYVLDKNVVALIPPFIPHLTVSGGTLPQRRLLINFAESYLHDIRKSLPLDILSCFGAPCTILKIADFAERFGSITNQLTSCTCESEQILLLCQLLSVMSANAPTHVKNEAMDIIRYVEENFSENITLEHLANKFYLSPFTVSRYFTRYTGSGLPKYLNAIRIINAKRYLKEGKSATEVALKCGFNSPSNFSRVFMSVEGLSPSEFKKKFSEN